jgi:hypothetical protein
MDYLNIIPEDIQLIIADQLIDPYLSVKIVNLKYIVFQINMHA